MLKQLLILCFVASASASEIKLNEKFIQAEIAVESGGKTNAVGDGGKAIGCLQIHEVCWKDAVQFDKSIGGTYSNCFNKDYSIKIMNAYLLRYCPKAVKENDFEAMSRCWNSGPNWKNKKKSTDSYWQKVKKHLN